MTDGNIKNIHEYSIYIVRQPIAFLLGFSLALVIFFYNYSIIGFGSMFIVFLFFVFLTFIAIGKNHFRLPVAKNINRVFIAHLIFTLVLFFSFYMNESLTSKDIRYLFSSAANIFWWHILFSLAVYQRKLFYHSFKIGYVLLAYLTIFSWVLLAAHTQNIFFLRYEMLNVGILKFTSLRNPNKLARITLIVTCILYFYYSTGRSYYKGRNLHLISLMMVLGFIIITTLSRANILSLGIFATMTFSIDKFKRVRTIRILRGVVVVAGVCLFIVLVMPIVQERFADAIRRMSLMLSSLGIDDPLSVTGRRTRTWLATVNLISDNSVFGVGFSGIEEHLRVYGSTMLGGSNPGGVMLVHGGFLKFAAYGGLLSLSAFLFLFFLLFWYALKIFLFSNTIWQKRSSYSLLILLFVLIPMNIGADSFGLSLTWMSISFLFINAQITQYSEELNSKVTRIKKVGLER